MTLVRDKSNEWMQETKMYFDPLYKGINVLEVGIDGDEKPGGNYKHFGLGNNYKTLDYLPSVNPDYVADITDTKMPDAEWDLIICSQVLEHVWDFKAAIKEMYRMLKPTGAVIIDLPWEFPYHGLPSYDDYWRISHKALRRLLEEVGFEIIDCKLCGPLVAAMARKPK